MFTVLGKTTLHRSNLLTTLEGELMNQPMVLESKAVSQIAYFLKHTYMKCTVLTLHSREQHIKSYRVVSSQTNAAAL